MKTGAEKKRERFAAWLSNTSTVCHKRRGERLDPPEPRKTRKEVLVSSEERTAYVHTTPTKYWAWTERFDTFEVGDEKEIVLGRTTVSAVVHVGLVLLTAAAFIYRLVGSLLIAECGYDARNTFDTTATRRLLVPIICVYHRRRKLSRC